MSFTETKINELTDDLHEQLANADKKQVWSINAPDKMYISVGEIFQPEYTISKDGLVVENNDAP